MLSFTVTAEAQVDMLLLLSVTVSVTVLGPTFAQVKLVLSIESDLMPQASLLPLLTSEAASVALPEASR
jgi:hypothetical protein